MFGSTVLLLRALVVALCLLAVAGTSAYAATVKRVALVIGNSTYPTAPLKNPLNDARAMAKTLKELGFEVTLRENTSQRDLAAAVRQFGASISPGSVALFYFAGHGMQVKGRNYLVPVDADIQVEDEVPYSTIDVNLVLDKMEVGKSATNIVILDACRNNPFARRFRSSATGLAQMDAPIGTLIAFATAPGSVAQDGTGENGIYTKHLLDSIAVPGLPVEQMFKRVRIGVAKETNEAQVPWESSSMKGDFVFREAAPQPVVSQDKLIEEAVRAAAEKAAALTAERLAREQAARPPQNDRAKAEQEALAAERERLLRERERLAAENEALRRKAAEAPAAIALAAPTPQAQPSSAPAKATGSLPALGESWTYRYSDGYNRTETYTVRVTEVTATGIRDEASLGKARHAASSEAGLEMPARKLGNLVVREFAPYLTALGPAEPNEEWQKIEIPGGSGHFVARWAGRESVQVPAGRFEARVLEVKGEQYARGVQTRPFTIRVWYAPEVRRFVRLKLSAPAVLGGIAEERDIIELVAVGTDQTAAAATRPAAMVASASPLAIADAAALPRPGDSWTYRYADVYGKTATYTVRVASVAEGEIADEARMGKLRHEARHEPGLSVMARNLGTLPVREISPYLLALGPLQEDSAWATLEIVEGSPPFKARLTGSESVTVPAGTFEARKVVIEGQQYRQRGNVSWGTNPYTITLWYAPAARRLVKARFDGPLDKETIELIEYRLQ
jgi:hypothetical protein